MIVLVSPHGGIVTVTVEGDRRLDFFNAQWQTKTDRDSNRSRFHAATPETESDPYGSPGMSQTDSDVDVAIGAKMKKS